MKSLFTLVATLSLLAVASCKQNNDPTPANTTDPYVGEYSLTGTETFNVDGKITTTNVGATMYVFAGTTPNSYYFLERLPAKTETGYFVTVNNKSFEAEVATDETFTDGNRWVGYRSAKGTFDGKTITFQCNTPSFTILNFTGPQYNPTSIKNMSRTVNLVAVHK